VEVIGTLLDVRFDPVYQGTAKNSAGEPSGSSAAGGS
jgi:hypothetical protein